MKKLLTLLIVGVLSLGTCFGLTACNNGSENGMEDGKLIFGYTIYKPMSYFEEGSSELVGFDVELAREVCKILDVECEFKEIEWKNKVMSLNSKEIDVVWNGMTISPELQEAMSITKPYLENRQVIVCKTEDAAKFAADTEKKGLNAKDLEIFVEKGSAGEDTVKGLGLSSTTVAAQKDTILEVKSGKNKVAVIDKLMAQVLTGEKSANPDLTFVDVNFALEQFGIGCRKTDTETTKAIEDALDQLKENGKYAEIQAKYFG